MKEDYNPTEIAIKLSRNKSTIYRIINSNSSKGEFNAMKTYKEIAVRKLNSSKQRRILDDSLLSEYIIEKIEEY